MVRGWLRWLRSKFSEAALTVPALDPRQTALLTASTSIEQPARKRTPAKAALPWTDEIATHNHQVWRDRETYRTYLRTAYDVGDEPLPAHFHQLEAQAAMDLRGEVVGTPEQLLKRQRELAIEYLVDQRIRQEERTANVTGLQPKFQAIPESQIAEAQELARMQRKVARLEERKATAVPAPGWNKPTPQEVLAAAGGDERKAAQIQAKVDAIFGTEGGHAERVEEPAAVDAGR